MNKSNALGTQPAIKHSLLAPRILQRKCECGNHTPAGGECAACGKQKSVLQRKTVVGGVAIGNSPPRVMQAKLSIGASDNPLEREVDRVANQVVANNTPSSVSSLAFGRLQREEAPKEKTNEEKYQEGLKNLGEAFLKTTLGKELLEKIKRDTLVKGATELGKDFISTWPGKIVTGAAATSAVAALAATHKELPAQIPEIPLDVLTPGLSVQLTYKGPVDKPTEAMITFKFTEQAPKGRDAKKPMSATDKFRAETARLAAEDAKFRAGMTYKPGSPEDLQQKAEQEAIRSAVMKYSGGPDIEATIKKYPWLATPQPKTGLQLTMPKPSFGIKPPALLGDEFKLKPPSEQKKKEDEPVLQKKLSIGASNDPLEDEADRIADQVLAAPAHPLASVAPVRIQRFSGQLNEGTDTAPASVDHVLASSGRPMEPALRQDMEQRFGHDFSRVRVHAGGAAEQSAREVNANAYTVGHNIVFGVGRFAPETHEGRRLIAHELTHVVQQSGSDGNVGQGDKKRGLSPIYNRGQTLLRKALSEAPYAEPTIYVPMDSPLNPNEVAADLAAAEPAATGSPADPSTRPNDGAAPSDGGADLPVSLAAEIMRPSGGGTLPPGLRAEQEDRHGCDLGHVRIHQGTRAAALANALDARAFTYGSDIWLGPSETIADRRLMTHELTHVVQQAPRPLPDAAAKGSESDAGKRVQATRRLYYALPALGKGSKGSGDRTHDYVQNILGSDTKNQPIFSEVPIPGGASTGSTGRADFLKTDTGTYFGVQFTGNSPAYLSLSGKSLLNGAKASDATHRKNAAPAGNTGIEGAKACALSGLPPAQGICRVDKGPTTVSIADLKPNYEAEILMKSPQVDRYVAMVNALSAKVNSFTKTSPTLIDPPGATWSGSAQRMKDIHIPPKFESPTVNSPHVAVHLYNNGVRVSIREADELQLPRTEQAVLQIAKHSDGFITYEYIPLRMLGTGTAAGGVATAKSTIADAKTKLDQVKTKLKEEPKRVSKMPRRANARPRLARKRDKLEAKDDFNFSTWKTSTFDPWQATAKTATGGVGKKARTDPSAEAEQRIKDEAVRQIDARTSFGTKSAPKGTAERTREIEVVQHWADHGEKYGRLRQIFGSAFVKVVKAYDSVKTKIEAKVNAVKQRMKRANSGSGGIKGAVLAALRGIAGSLLGVFIRDVGNRLVTAIQKGATVLLGSLFGEEVEKIEEQLAAIEKTEADFKALIAETLEDKFAEQLKELDEKLKQIESIAATISGIGSLVNLVKWAYRIAQCAAPPLLGCLIALVGTAIAEAIIAAIVASCWFRREIAYPIVSALGPIRKLPGLAAKAIADRVRDLLPVSVKPLIAEVDLSDLESKANDVDCDTTSQYNKMDANQRKLAEMLKQYDPDHVESLMKALEHLGVAKNPPDPSAKLEGAEIDALKKLLDKYSKQQLEDIVASTPPEPPRMGGAGDFIADLDNEGITQSGGMQGGQPTPPQGGPIPSSGPPPTAEEIAKEGADIAERLKKSKTKVKPDQRIFAQPDGKKGDVVNLLMLNRWGTGPITGGFQKLTITDVAADGGITATVHAGTRYYNADGVYVETSTEQTAVVFNPVGGRKKK